MPCVNLSTPLPPLACFCFVRDRFSCGVMVRQEVHSYSDFVEHNEAIMEQYCELVSTCVAEFRVFALVS